MNGLQSLDTSLFRWINSSLANPVMDWLMPFLSGNPFYVPALLCILGWLIWKGGARGRICAFCVILAIALGDGVICKLIKDTVGRARPFVQLEGVRLLVGRGGSKSMPSSHAANSFAIVMAFYVFYRRSWRFTLPLAVAISFSRVYNGVHFPTDVLAGAILGAGYTAGGIWALNRAWIFWGSRFLPLWWNHLPSLIELDAPPVPVNPPRPAGGVILEQHWIRVGHLMILLLLAAQLGYLALGKIELSEDEAYQWLWSKHPALSYYSKPPLIAWTQWLGTHLWGDTAFGVRFFSPVIASVLGWVTLRFFAGQGRARTGFWVVLALTATPMLAAGSILMTIDPLLVLFWTLGMLAGWRAVQPEGRTQDWALSGFWLGLALLSKYTALFQLASWAVFFAIWPPARAHLRRAGPWLALGIATLCLTPVLVWNASHDWITIQHVANDGKLGETWQPKAQFFWDFAASEIFLLNPFFVILLLLAARRGVQQARDPLDSFLFWMGAPVFLFYLAFTLHSRVLPNWIAPCVLPFFLWGALRWPRLQENWPRLAPALLGGGLAAGLLAAVLLHDTQLIEKMIHRSLPVRLDPLRRVQGWSEFAAVIEAEREKLQARGGEVFVVADHYGRAGLLSFYMPRAKAAVQAGGRPLVYCVATERPEDQFYFWPGYAEQRAGENGLFVQELGNPGLREGWLGQWLREGDSPALSKPPETKIPPLPRQLRKQFARVEDLGPVTVICKGRPYHYYRLYYCENANPPGLHE